MEHQAQIVTIIIHSDIDPSELLDLANRAASHLVCEIHDHLTHGDESAFFLEEETSVEWADENDNNIVGGRQHE